MAASIVNTIQRTRIDGYCRHVAAALFDVMAYMDDEGTSCTSRPCVWTHHATTSSHEERTVPEVTELPLSTFEDEGKKPDHISSVLNRDVKQFGKKHLFDGDDETCWNSDQGTPQWIVLDFEEPVQIQRLCVQFQGGFVGKDCHLETCSSESKELCKFFSFNPQDSNQLQEFEVRDCPQLQSLRILFNSSTDFYGRITIYKLDLIGQQT